jgi:signal transduction histidine kinase
VRQILWNLATNGLRAMPSSGRLRMAVMAERWAQPPGDRTDARLASSVVIDVQDEGVGIAPEELDGIFQPFRGGFARGTGLGLSIVHRIATDYGGDVRVRSMKGHGTTVEVALPLEPAPAGAAAIG